VIILAIIAGLSVFTLTRSGNLHTAAIYEYADELAGRQAIEVRRRIEIFGSYGNMIAQLFGAYNNTPEYLRRDNYNDILYSTIQQNVLIMGIWTAWLPGTLDNRDNELGQYSAFYTRRRTGSVESVSAGYEGWQNYLANMTGKPALASPVWRDIFGQGNVPIIAIMYPIKNEKSGKLVGLVGINYVSDMQETVNELVGEVYNGKGVAAVYANDGVIVAHYDKTRIKENIRDNPGEKELLGDQHNRVIESIRKGGDNGKPITVNRYSSVKGTELHLIYQPISVSGIDTPWCLLVGIPMNEITKPIRETMLITIIFAFVVLVAAAAIVFFVVQNIVKPILGVTSTLKDISEGEGDLTRKITTSAKDEIGVLANYFNLTLEKIKNLIINIKKEASDLSRLGADLANQMSETAAAINEITSNIQSIKDRIINQSASVTETNATMEQITVNIDKLNGHVELQTNSVSRSSSAIEEMLANINSVTQTLIQNADNVKELTDASEVGRTGLHDVATDITEIAKESEGLLEINFVMENIASQTNLLSMNAAIEAAHAGEAGKGFAVVADEIRKLAESSGEQSKIISSVLKRIKESIDKITKSTDNVLQKFEAIDTSVKTVAEQETHIRNAMEEQGEGSKQILEAIGQVNGITREVKESSNIILEGSYEVIRESRDLGMTTQEISGGINEMAQGADHINAAVNNVNNLCGKNRESIDNLVREVSRFKVE